MDGETAYDSVRKVQDKTGATNANVIYTYILN
jgi:hypothetical protein